MHSVEEEALRRLALGDERFLRSLMDGRPVGLRADTLTHAEQALVRIGALAGTDGSDLTWMQTINGALGAGVTVRQILDALLVLAPILGATRIAAIAPKVALATGVNLDSALEMHA
jgi:alkylhydroperoxidase/carboxymuconolactone decarboxylase family protein YurZ